MMPRHPKVLRQTEEDGYIPRHARDLRNTRNDLDLRDGPDPKSADGDGDPQEDG
ncbi:hypothetical protein [Dactylosporangium sp. CA-233914]|uniref:hypothetical protein n=1 Tax=Dactylosporangium sp. CA-233914 TaxID=3239934 RepID=UPI003D8C1683